MTLQEGMDEAKHRWGDDAGVLTSLTGGGFRVGYYTKPRHDRSPFGDASFVTRGRGMTLVEAFADVDKVALS